MTHHKRTEITIETERVLTIRKCKSLVPAWCSTCAKQVPMVKVDEAASIARVSSRTIYHWAETEKVHFTETTEGLLLICLNSLPSELLRGL